MTKSCVFLELVAGAAGSFGLSSSVSCHLPRDAYAKTNIAPQNTGNVSHCLHAFSGAMLVFVYACISVNC